MQFTQTSGTHKINYRKYHPFKTFVVGEIRDGDITYTPWVDPESDSEPAEPKWTRSKRGSSYTVKNAKEGEYEFLFPKSTGIIDNDLARIPPALII